ncbi:hypothetical protein BMF94_2876 [Rhodotorula taiwanensis]|uniref:Uncharacterized protein n=1 Tax=Rhodotorula taiwanensis TaxID=741276 RepID=A0A2S5BBC0_9BASI|nr:hypothetical protein BMF94_2876 [Rhodotorula taiwanensis]
MHSPVALVLSLLTLSHFAHSLPTLPRRDINISHKSLTNGTTTTHSISNADLPLELAKALEGSDVNINLTTDRRRSWAGPAVVTNTKRATSSSTAGVNNSTINLTVIGARSIPQPKRLNYYQQVAAAREGLLATESSTTAAPTNNTLPAAHASAPSASTGTHHNIHIDASSSGEGGIGGIHNSTVNINLHQTSTNKVRKMLRRKLNLGDHSVLVDISSTAAASSEDPTASNGGLEDSTVHVNILPGRSLTKSLGHHSIVVDSSTLSQQDAALSSTETGSHSAVVDTSSTSADSTTANATGPAGVKGSTINLTVISPSDPKPAPVAENQVDATVPALSRLSKRANAAAEEWATTFVPADQLNANAEGSTAFVVVRRNHASRR